MPTKPTSGMPPPTLNKQRLARLLSHQTRITNRMALEVLDALTRIISDHLAQGGRVEIANFLTLTVVSHTRAIMGGSPEQESGLFEEKNVPYVTLRCKPGKRLRARLGSRAARR